MPPVQRTAVWTPKQVVDLWDSLFRGLPIGSFYLVRRSGRHDAQVRGIDSAAPVRPIEQDGFDLLDGRQRTRAMLLGLVGPKLEKRCLWVDLGADVTPRHIRVHLTSASQPFGYQPENGQKLPVADRRKAREKLERDLGYWKPCGGLDRDPAYKGPLLKSDDKAGERPAYDHELFERFLEAAEQHSDRLPRPYKASASTYPVDFLLGEWCMGERNSGRCLEALRSALAGKPLPDESRIERLHEAFRRVAGAQVALLLIDPTTFERSDDAGQAHESLLMLFDRIGAGGTPLTAEERLFSIYKHHRPLVHNLVNDIHKEVRRVLPPTKIVASALRIANARTHKEHHEGNTVPDAATFAKKMAGIVAEQSSSNRRTKSLRLELDDLLFPDPTRGEGALVTCFAHLFELLCYDKDNELGLPRVMLTTLPPQLVQVLLFWVLLVRETTGSVEAFRAFREDVIRFAMFWHLCVWNEDKAGTRCYEFLWERMPSGVPHARGDEPDIESSCACCTPCSPRPRG